MRRRLREDACFIHIIGMIYTECCPVLIGQNQQKHEKHIKFFFHVQVSCMNVLATHTIPFISIFFW